MLMSGSECPVCACPSTSCRFASAKNIIIGTPEFAGASSCDPNSSHSSRQTSDGNALFGGMRFGDPLAR